MGPNKDEILKRAQEAFDQEQRRRDIGARDQKPMKMTSGMPWGCWIWIVAGLALAFWLVKKYGLGI
jgi:hypothetical protein